MPAACFKRLTTLPPLVAAVVAASLAGANAAPASDSVTRIAFGSCALESKPQPIWKAVDAARPQVIVMIGDNIYADTEDMAVMRRKYQQLADNPDFAKAIQGRTLIGTWDDHDYGVNDGGAEYPMKKQSQKEFADFFKLSKFSPVRMREGVYDSYIFENSGKKTQVILLDTRYFRSPLTPLELGKKNRYKPSEDKLTTMLGEAQWKWLEGELRKPADLRIIASSIQVIPQDHVFEKWYNLPHERDRLYKLIADTKAEGVVFISGDRHLAELSVMDGGVGYPLYDLTSSGLNRGGTGWRLPESNQRRHSVMNKGDNFGLITVDWSRPDPEIQLEVRDVDGMPRIREVINLSNLKIGTIK